MLMAILSRFQKDICWKCGNVKQGELTAHHIIPRRAGGATEPRNLAPLCTRCHIAYHLFEEMLVGRVYRYRAVFFKWLMKGVDEDKVEEERVKRIMIRNKRIKEKKNDLRR